MLHDDLRLTVEAFQKVRQLSEFGGGVADLKRLRHHHAKRTEYRNHALSLRNVDSDCVHEDTLPSTDSQWTGPPSPIADSICLLTRTLRFPGGSTCTNRTLRMRGWLTDLRRTFMSLRQSVRPLLPHSTALARDAANHGWLLWSVAQIYSNSVIHGRVLGFPNRPGVVRVAGKRQ